MVLALELSLRSRNQWMSDLGYDRQLVLVHANVIALFSPSYKLYSVHFLPHYIDVIEALIGSYEIHKR